MDNWYHTIELAPGFTTRAIYDHRPIVNRVGLPDSLKGKTALDVGTYDGFWAFEMERRGADRVVATDVDRMDHCDMTPAVRAARSEEWKNHEPSDRFRMAHEMLHSRVEYRKCNVYDLSPERVGVFDMVYCGSLLMHLFNPIQALINIRSVTSGMAIVETCGHRRPLTLFDRWFPGQPYMIFGQRKVEKLPGDEHGYWQFSKQALCDMLIYAGFSSVEPKPPYLLSGPLGGEVYATSVVAYV